MTYQFIAFIIISILFIAFLGFLSINQFLNIYFEKKREEESYTDSSILEKIDFLIDFEFNFQVQLSHIGKNINVITKFESLSNEMAHNITNRVTMKMVNDFCRYTGTDREFFHIYIVRRIELKIFEYMKTHPLTK